MVLVAIDGCDGNTGAICGTRGTDGADSAPSVLVLVSVVAVFVGVGDLVEHLLGDRTHAPFGLIGLPIDVATRTIEIFGGEESHALQVVPTPVFAAEFTGTFLGEIIDGKLNTFEDLCLVG